MYEKGITFVNYNVHTHKTLFPRINYASNFSVTSCKSVFVGDLCLDVIDDQSYYINITVNQPSQKTRKLHKTSLVQVNAHNWRNLHIFYFPKGEPEIDLD